MNKTVTKPVGKSKSAISYYEGVGRRKESVARVRLHISKAAPVVFAGAQLKPGDISVNGLKIEDVFPSDFERKIYTRPLALIDSLDRFVVTIKVVGGGKAGQLDAIVHGIARALVKIDLSYKPTMKQAGLLTRDARIRERRKVGTGGKARRQKQSPKR